MRLNARVDANQPEIVEALREKGASVVHLHPIGRGVPDILVGINGQNYLVEIKDGSKPASKQKLTSDQQIFHANWKGQVKVIHSVEEALNLFLETVAV